MHYQPFDLSRRQYLGGDAGNSHGTDGDDDDDGCDDDDDRHEDQQDHDDHDRRDDGHQADDGDGDCNFAVEIPKVTSFGRLTIQGFSLVSDAGLMESGSMSRVEIWHCCRSIDADAFSEKTDFLSRNCIMCADV